MIICEQCGHSGMSYSGVVDGLGDYGEDLCDQYECPNCGHVQTEECFDTDNSKETTWDWNNYTDEIPYYSSECSMCGKDMPYSSTGRCSYCEMVWNS